MPVFSVIGAVVGGGVLGVYAYNRYFCSTSKQIDVSTKMHNKQGKLIDEYLVFDSPTNTIVFRADAGQSWKENHHEPLFYVHYTTFSYIQNGNEQYLNCQKGKACTLTDTPTKFKLGGREAKRKGARKICVLDDEKFCWTKMQNIQNVPHLEINDEEYYHTGFFLVAA